MAITTLSSREYNRDRGRARRASQHGPVIITDRGRPANVLLSYDEYQRLTGQKRNIVEMLSMPCAEVIEFEAPRLDGGFPQAAELD
ncbi:MAG: type II toxin-antitoxin system prevent-host-death family antitoxin [Terracidiphilus sp.]